MCLQHERLSVSTEPRVLHWHGHHCRLRQSHLAVCKHGRAGVCQEHAVSTSSRQRQPRQTGARAELKANAGAQSLSAGQHIVCQQQRAAPYLRQRLLT